ncbi:AAA family ATPase [Metabacillus litoralis]|uniref:AAA family ATPase n=1 Tax=Metabacillus litoralis TaxID=152268 RepID=UPI000EF55E5B|nr:hypothetical protein [Metabacillus litoralis]
MFSFSNMISDIYKEYNTFSKSEIEDLLFIDDIDKDSPISQNNRLRINKLIIKGEKNTGEIIEFSKDFYSGVNVIFAENGKGKSSLFKIIKFGLTGDKESIKKDVLKWLNEVSLEFNIGETTYTTYIDLSGKRTQGVLYRKSINEILAAGENIERISIIFETKTDKDFKEFMQEFIYNQFSYYSLKWTSGNKDTIDLIENQTSWKTYYKSIYLESKDYNVLFLNSDFGSQGKKILEMLLGLRLTYAINYLTQKKDHLANSQNKQDYLMKQNNDQINVEELIEELESIEEDISKLQEDKKKTFRKSLDIEKYNSLSNDLKTVNDELQKAINEKEELEKQLNQTNRRLIRLEEEREFGAFFSNLEIKMCPRCEHTIQSNKKEVEKSDHKCMLCEHELEDASPEQKEIIDIKINELKKEAETLATAIELLIGRIDDKQQISEQYLIEIQKIESNIETVDFLNDDIDTLSNLIQQKVEIEYQIKMNSFANKDDSQNLDEKIKVLEHAIKYLNSHRLELSKEILKSLEELILSQINKFGLTNVTDVVISKNLDIQFLQNGELNKFSELTEGEQLRAKIAFYLGLMLLDINYGMGRHPRLLIIDSPGKEEVISKDLISLASIFKEIEESYSDKLQIIIGTALEELVDASASQKVLKRGNEEFVF